MNLIWTAAGGSAVTLGDDSAKKTILVESGPGGQAQVQVAQFFRGTNPALYARGNAQGQFVFTVTQTFGSQDLANAFLKAEYARIGQQGSLAWGRGESTTFTMANAVLRAVMPARINGVQVQMRYTFDITTLT